MEKILSFIENNKNIDAIQFELSYDSDAQAMLSIVRFQANLYSEPNSDVRKLKRALDKDFGSWDGKKHEYGNIRGAKKPIFWKDYNDGTDNYICYVDTTEKSFDFWNGYVSKISKI